MTRIHRVLSCIVAFILLVSFTPTYAFASNQTVRLAGNSRYDTSIAISQQGWNSSDFAIIASGERFQDALIAAPLSKLYNAPILLTSGGELDDKLKNELARLNVKKVYLVGAMANVSSVIEYQLYLQGIETIRLAGKTDYDTSVVAAQKFGAIDTVVLVNRDSYADALSIAPIAAVKGWPILFTQKEYLPDSVAQYLASQNIKKAYIIGGTGVISSEVASKTPSPERVWGIDRYDTNMQVIRYFSSDIQTQKVYLATGENYPDALSGTPLAQITKSPLVLVNPYGMSDATKQYFLSLQDSSVFNILGGTGVVSDSVLQQIGKSVSTSPETEYMSDKFEPYYTYDDYTYNEGLGYKVNPIPAMKMGSKAYYKGYQFHTDGTTYTASFNMNGNINSISGVIGFDDNCDSVTGAPSKTFTVIFNGDTKMLGQYDIKPGDLPQSFNINVTGIKKLDIVISRDHDGITRRTYIDFANVLLNSTLTKSTSVPSSSLSGQYMSDKFEPYYTYDDYMFNEGLGYTVNPVPAMKIGSKTYYKGYQFHTDGTAYTASFNLEGNVNSLSGLIGFDDNYDPITGAPSKTFTIIFNGDNKILRQYDIAPGDLPKNFSVDVTGINKLDIVISREHDGVTRRTYIDFADIMLN